MQFSKSVLVTGGAGFIGSNLVRHLLRNTDYRVINLDKLTYAGNLESLADVQEDPQYIFKQIDICDHERISDIFNTYAPDIVMHLAAESHVDRSIDGPAEFLTTNILGTFNLLQVSSKYFNTLGAGKKDTFRFLHVSTDEVFGSLGKRGLFNEDSAYRPNSPYSASKASSDHLVRAWHHTFSLPVLITNCSNNFGPYQFPEKLIPVMVLNAVQGKPLPLYGKGENIRDWLFVEDHVRALLTVAEKGRAGQTYNIGARNEHTNLDLVKMICAILDELRPDQRFKKHESLIQFVPDRPGHDLRYAIDPTKIETELGWHPAFNFTQSLRITVEWYLHNQAWCDHIFSKAYRLERQGLGGIKS